MDNHTECCRQRLKTWARATAAYRELWPNHCRYCTGWGEIYFEDDVDFCPKCIVDDKCPRCACDHFYQDASSVCPGCNWMIGVDDGCPVKPECYCEENA